MSSSLRMCGLQFTFNNWKGTYDISKTGSRNRVGNIPKTCFAFKAYMIAAAHLAIFMSIYLPGTSLHALLYAVRDAIE